MTGGCHWAAPGVRCVCIDGDWGSFEQGGSILPVRVPMLGEVLTVREARPPLPDADWGDPSAIYLDFWEIPRSQTDGPLMADVRWLATKFEPLVEEPCGRPRRLAMSGEKARRVRHMKRGTTYEVLGEASVQISYGLMQSRLPHLGKLARNLVEGDRLTVYRSEADGSLWARFPDEFEDGRFEELLPAPDAQSSAVVNANIGDLTAALAIAAAVHDGQTDKAGRPYLAHPLRMVVRALERWHSPDIAIVAALHDVVEDSAISLDDLRTKGFSEHVVDAVEALTRRDGEPYSRMIIRAKCNRLAHIVKLLDVEDNADPVRLAKIRDSELRLRLTLKYATARRDLLAGCSVCELGDVG